jgi:hypothetical protein
MSQQARSSQDRSRWTDRDLARTGKSGNREPGTKSRSWLGEFDVVLVGSVAITAAWRLAAPGALLRNG